MKEKWAKSRYRPFPSAPPFSAGLAVYPASSLPLSIWLFPIYPSREPRISLNFSESILGVWVVLCWQNATACWCKVSSVKKNTKKHGVLTHQTQPGKWRGHLTFLCFHHQKATMQRPSPSVCQYFSPGFPRNDGLWGRLCARRIRVQSVYRS